MLPLAFLLCLLVKTSIVSSCVSDSFINGCSVPINSSSFPYKTFFHEACQKHDVCYYCGDMHQWTKQDCDDGFYNDMMEECRKAHVQTRKKRHIQDFIPLLRHKYKKVTLDDAPNQNLYHMWHTVCQWAAGAYFHAVRLFGHGYYQDPSPDSCIDQCVIPRGKPNLS